MGDNSTAMVSVVDQTTGEVAQVPAIPTQAQSGAIMLAQMSDQEFQARIAMLRRGQERVREIQKAIMEENVDYGRIPGTTKPTLLKPGAEKLCSFYGYVATFTSECIPGDGVHTPPIRYIVTCNLHAGSEDDPVIAAGLGAANSWEKRYRYRAGGRICPKCGAMAINKSKFDGGWYCYDKKGGCGAKFTANDPEIVSQQLGDIENPDPYDIDNTLLKMAEKRAYIDATLRATATSGLFTQDVEDLADASTKPTQSAQSTRPASYTRHRMTDSVLDDPMETQPAQNSAPDVVKAKPVLKTTPEQCALFESIINGDEKLRKRAITWAERQFGASLPNGFADLLAIQAMTVINKTKAVAEKERVA
jgi:hypothetical protein